MATKMSKLCLDIGKTPSPDRYSMWFNFLTEIGDVVYKDGSWNESSFEKLRESAEDDAFMAIVRKYLNGEYIYSCWYQAKMRD